MERGPHRLCRGRHPARLLEPAKTWTCASSPPSRRCRATARPGPLVGGITIAPNQWPTHSGDRLAQHPQARATLPQREQRLQEATQILRGPPELPGHQAGVRHRAGRLLVVAHAERRRQHRAPDSGRDGRPGWKDDMGRLANGFISRQQGGAWPPPRPTCGAGWRWRNSSAKFRATRWLAPPRPPGQQPAPAWTGARSNASNPATKPCRPAQYTRGDVPRRAGSHQPRPTRPGSPSSTPSAGATILGSGLDTTPDRHQGERRGTDTRLAAFEEARSFRAFHLLRIPAQGAVQNGVRRAAEQRGRLRAAPQPRRGLYAPGRCLAGTKWAGAGVAAVMRRFRLPAGPVLFRSGRAVHGSIFQGHTILWPLCWLVPIFHGAHGINCSMDAGAAAHCRLPNWGACGLMASLCGHPAPIGQKVDLPIRWPYRIFTSNTSMNLFLRSTAALLSALFAPVAAVAKPQVATPHRHAAVCARTCKSSVTSLPGGINHATVCLNWSDVEAQGGAIRFLCHDPCFDQLTQGAVVDRRARHMGRTLMRVAKVR